VAGHAYHVTVGPTVFKDYAEQNFPGFSKPTDWNFVVAGAFSPSARPSAAALALTHSGLSGVYDPTASLSPSYLQRNVAINRTQLNLTFTENILKGTGIIQVTDIRHVIPGRLRAALERLWTHPPLAHSKDTVEYIDVQSSQVFVNRVNVNNVRAAPTLKDNRSDRRSDAATHLRTRAGRSGDNHPTEPTGGRAHLPGAGAQHRPHERVAPVLPGHHPAPVVLLRQR
jgi:hypothetical protein